VAAVLLVVAFVGAFYVLNLIHHKENTKVEIVEPPKDSHVVPLYENTFLDKTGEGKWLVTFFSNWIKPLGHCADLVPTWDKLAPTLSGEFHVGAVDCSKERNLCVGFMVRGFPTIVYVSNGTYHDFRGERTIEGFSKFARKSKEEPHPVPGYDQWKKEQEEIKKAAELQEAKAREVVYERRMRFRWEWVTWAAIGGLIGMVAVPAGLGLASKRGAPPTQLNSSYEVFLTVPFGIIISAIFAVVFELVWPYEDDLGRRSIANTLFNFLLILAMFVFGARKLPPKNKNNHLLYPFSF